MTADNHAHKNALATLDEIESLIARYTDDDATDEVRDEVQEEIYEMPLSVEVRSDWQTLDDLQLEPAEYKILLTWGGPACQVTGNLSDGNPSTAAIQYQDWFTQWENLSTDSDQDDILLQFAQMFDYVA